MKYFRAAMVALVLAGGSLGTGSGCGGGREEIPLADVPPPPPPPKQQDLKNAPPPGERSPDYVPPSS